MTTIFRVLIVVFLSALLLPSMQRELKAEEALAQISDKRNKEPANAKTALPSNSSSSQGQTLSKVSKSSNLINTRQEGSRSGQTDKELSPVFQISPDPRDKVRFLIEKGIVTVRGSVGTRELARKLIDKYARMPGVREVRNRLTVRTNNDAQIAVQVREALSHNPDTHVGRIAVTVCDGIVFLSGAVSSAQESERAEKLARGLQGVRQVNNGLRFAGQNRYPVQVTPRAGGYARRR